MQQVERKSLSLFTITRVFVPSSKVAIDQIADVDSGVIRRVNADLVMHILPTGSAWGSLQAITIYRCSGVPVDRAAAERVLAGVAS